MHQHQFISIGSSASMHQYQCICIIVSASLHQHQGFHEVFHEVLEDQKLRRMWHSSAFSGMLVGMGRLSSDSSISQIWSTVFLQTNWEAKDAVREEGKDENISWLSPVSNEDPIVVLKKVYLHWNIRINCRMIWWLTFLLTSPAFSQTLQTTHRETLFWQYIKDETRISNYL